MNQSNARQSEKTLNSQARRGVQKGGPPTGAPPSANDVLAHEAICCLDDAICQIAYGQMTMAHAWISYEEMGRWVGGVNVTQPGSFIAKTNHFVDRKL